MPSWFIRPDTRRLALSDEQWILVKQRLNTGEHRAHLARSSVVGSDGLRRLDGLLHGFSLVVAYLLDWSLPDAVIRGGSDVELTAALDNLAPERFAEIKLAIEAHEAAMEAAREVEKNAPDGGTNGSATLPSRSEPAGPLATFVPLTATTTLSS